MSTPDYISSLRQLVGTAPINLAGAAGLVLNSAGEVLLQRRTDTGTWGTLGGLAELGEALEDTLRRELWEEARLTVNKAELLTVVSGRHTYQKLSNGDEFYQMTAVYVVRDWEGIPTPDGREGTALQFFALDALPSPLGPVDTRALILLQSRKKG